MDPTLPTGLYELLVTLGVEKRLAELAAEELQTDTLRLDPEEAPEILGRHVSHIVARALRALPAEDRLQRGVEACNAALEILRSAAPHKAFDDHDDDIHPDVELLRSVYRQETLTGGKPPERPATPLNQNALLTNTRGDPKLGHELASELKSSDGVSLICAFVRWTGFRLLEKPITRFLEAGKPFRIITTTYLGATERRALDHLDDLGAQIKVSYETRTTRLHAKAWLFRRDSGFSTAYIGSSNLSTSALLDGLEWNVRLSEDLSSELIEKFAGTFENYWEDPHFEDYDREEFSRRSRQESRDRVVVFTGLDVTPYPFQRQILEQLEAERELRGRWNNLIVAATGTGKTVIAALDYRRLKQRWGDPSLLFVAHRREILEQSLGMFRAVLRDGNFGELYVAGHRPDEWRYVFASIQSLTSFDPGRIASDHFDIVVVDEFHHAEAKTYKALIQHLKPKLLLGLTATPERADGTNVSAWFDGHLSAELRLWDALEQHLLCPFHYFGVHDDVDLSRLRWRRGGYDVADLESIYTRNDLRVAKIVQVLQDKVADVSRMKALGFCVSVEHARYMARKFEATGIPARALSAETPDDERQSARNDLVSGRINVLFVVDLFNEGVDIPELDTVLFLRPTESATVFLQQLGRGLRHAEGKSCLTVLDFIGIQNRRFRFLERFRALSSGTPREVEKEIQEDFPHVPPGCHIELDRVSQKIVLDNIRDSIPSTWQRKVNELRSLGDVSLERYLTESRQDLMDIYRTKNRSWCQLRRDAGFLSSRATPPEAALASAIKRILHFDDVGRIDFLLKILKNDSPPEFDQLDERARRQLTMFHSCLRDREKWDSLEKSIGEIWESNNLRLEFVEILEFLRDRVQHVGHQVDLDSPVPLSYHASFSLREILAAFGESTAEKPSSFREGARFVKDYRCDVFFVTLNKSEREYSPTTMYRDYAISPSLFHWESQSTTTESSTTGQRYIHHRDEGSRIILFARTERQFLDGRTRPYVCLGTANYVSHKGERPMAIVWRLDHDMPPEFFQAARLAAG